MELDIPEYALEIPLAYDGRRRLLGSAHFIKFVFKTVQETECVPHGISYSLPMHDPKGNRLMGFDNAHPINHRGSAFASAPKAADHWHRTIKDPGRPYIFDSSWKLMSDFFDEIERILAELKLNF